MLRKTSDFDLRAERINHGTMSNLQASPKISLAQRVWLRLRSLSARQRPADFQQPQAGRRDHGADQAHPAPSRDQE